MTEHGAQGTGITGASAGHHKRHHGASGSPPRTRLAAGPRHVPFAYRLVVVNLSFWTLFALLMLAVPLPVLTKHVPIAGLVVGVVIAGSFLVRHVWQAHVRNALLRWGEVAEVTGSHLLARGTYYTGTTVQNTRLSQANGWHVTRRTYSGPISRTRIDYRINGTPASMVLRGLAYTNGVVLADPRKPSRALCVSSFPYDVEPDANGNWPGRVTAGLLAWSVATTLLLLAWAAGVVALYLHYR